MIAPLNNREFGELFDHLSHRAFRLETSDYYSVPEESENYRRFLNGEPLPLSDNDEWCQMVRENINLGKVMERVHIVSSPLTPYLRFEIDWGYVYSSAAGEKIHLLDRAKVPERVPVNDYWLFDNKILVFMRYDKAGSFVIAEREDEPTTIATYVEMSALLLSISIPLTQHLIERRTA